MQSEINKMHTTISNYLELVNYNNQIESNKVINLEEVHHLYKVYYMFDDVKLREVVKDKILELTGDKSLDELYSALYNKKIYEISKDCISEIREYLGLFEDAEIDIINIGNEYLLIEMYKFQDVVKKDSREFLGSRKFKLN